MMLEWFYELLGGWLGKGDGKRRKSLCGQRSRALSVFEETKHRLNNAKDNLAGEKVKCNHRIAKKRVELQDEELAVTELLQEQDRIDVTVANIDKMLGIEVPNEAKGDIN